MFRKTLECCLTAGAILLPLSCDSIYDDPADMPVVKEDNAYSYIDATEYTNWVYLNLEDGSQTTLAYDNTADIPAEWTFALHRYDCKTNGGSAYETSFSTLDELTAAIAGGTFTVPDASQFTADEDGKITVDMSGMMQGVIEYADSKINKVLGLWLDVNTSQMPPIYTMSKKVYLLRTSGGAVAAIEFTDYANPSQYNTKGFISFKYIYPLTD